MDHKLCESLIDDYIEDKLSGKQLEEFLKHATSCPKCYNELSINYSLISALRQIDEGDDMSQDFDVELEDKINKYYMKKRQARSLRIATGIFLLVASFAITIIISILVTREKLVYSKDHNATTIALENQGMPKSLDPVENMIDKYNVEIIKYLQSLNEKEGE